MTNPIEALVARLEEQPLWMNGLSPEIDLGPAASTDEVLSNVFGGVGFDEGHVASHTVMEVRDVYIGPVARWWSRVYDVEP